MLIDIGANLTNGAFRRDLEAVLVRARQAGVGTIIVTGTDAGQSRAARELAARHPGFLFATAGVHPHHADDFAASALDVLADLAQDRAVVAIGECGLDFNRNYSTPAAQERCFEAQLELAAEVKLPVFLHQRDAHDRFIAILARWRDRLVDAVVHCFTDGPEEAAAYRDLDLHFGITGWICDDRRAGALRRSMAHVPLERLMIETDAPYLLPAGVRPSPKGRRNEPMFLPLVCAAASAYAGVDEEALAGSSTRVASAFFRLPAQAGLRLDGGLSQ